MTWAVYECDVPVMLALRSMMGWGTTAWWRSRASWEMAKVEHKYGFHNQWRVAQARECLDKEHGEA